eukprot:366031-Chlamydomonas_euryale.AAC.23
MALCLAARGGHAHVVEMLLEWPSHAPRADAGGGAALVEAARSGSEAVVKLLLRREPCAPTSDAVAAAVDRGHSRIARLLLEWPVGAPPANVRDGELLVAASCAGDVDMVEYFLASPQAPRADCQDGAALLVAAAAGAAGCVEALLRHATGPPADMRDGAALVVAAQHLHTRVVRLLLNWDGSGGGGGGAPRANTRGGEALVAAATGNTALRAGAADAQLEVAHMLLDAPSEPAFADCQCGRALFAAAAYGRCGLARLLIDRWPRCRRGVRLQKLVSRAADEARKQGHTNMHELLMRSLEEVGAADPTDARQNEKASPSNVLALLQL